MVKAEKEILYELVSKTNKTDQLIKMFNRIRKCH